MIAEAAIRENEGTRFADGDGWFVLNAREVPWQQNQGLGRDAWLEGRASFELGMRVEVLLPGEASGMYHREPGNQEDFLVVSGECVLIVEGQERRLRAWDFVHCPPGTNHIFVGAGEGPCIVFMVGARASEELVYPVDELASRHGASVSKETGDPDEAYAQYPGEWKRYREGDLPG